MISVYLKARYLLKECLLMGLLRFIWESNMSHKEDTNMAAFSRQALPFLEHSHT